MSGLIPFGLSVAEATVQGLIGPIIVRQRNIGGFVANVTVREEHEDEVQVTENPVEYGAAVTDHSFKTPSRLTIDVGYSNSSIDSLGDPNYVNDIYAQFLQMQADRQLIDVITGKRMYTDMLITLLHTMTNEEHENDLLLTVKLRQLILVGTQTVSVPPASNMSNPASNGATQSQGTQQLTNATSGGAPNSTPFNYSSAPFSAGFGTGD